MKKKNIAKKTIILYIFKLLYNGTCRTAPVRQIEIVNVLKSIGVECDRRTVSRNIQYLIDFGLPIILKKGKNGGYFYLHEKDNFFIINKKGDNV